MIDESGRDDTADPRRAGFLLGAAGALLALYPMLRPYSDETTLAGATAMASGAWVTSHLFAMAGFVALSLGLLLAGDAFGRGDRRYRAAVGTIRVGVGLTLPYYGAETFALAKIGARTVRDGDPTLLGLTDAIRFGPVQGVTFVVGLLALAVGAVLVALAVGRPADGWHRFAGVPLAVGFVLLLPQFFTPAPLRVAHGLLMAVGCGCLVATLTRAATRDVRGPGADRPV